MSINYHNQYDMDLMSLLQAQEESLLLEAKSGVNPSSNNNLFIKIGTHKAQGDQTVVATTDQVECIKYSENSAGVKDAKTNDCMWSICAPKLFVYTRFVSSEFNRSTNIYPFTIFFVTEPTRGQVILSHLFPQKTVREDTVILVDTSTLQTDTSNKATATKIGVHMGGIATIMRNDFYLFAITVQTLGFSDLKESLKGVNGQSGGTLACQLN